MNTLRTNVVDDGQILKLTVEGAFRFSEILKYLARNANECLFSIRGGRVYKAIPIAQQTPVVEISAERDNKDNIITVRFLGETNPSEKRVRTAVARYIINWFDLDRDLSPFYELAQTDRLLKQAVDVFYGLRMVGISDLFEVISWGIIGQQINLAFAYTLKRRLVENFGRKVECEGEVYWIFPAPQDIAALTIQDLSPLRMTVKKCEYLIGVAKLMAEGNLTKELLAGAGEFKKAEKTLISIRGIGPWTANYVLMRCLRVPSAFPIDDVGLQNSIKHLLRMEKKPSKDEILKLSAGWTNWEAYATFYLWRFLY